MDGDNWAFIVGKKEVEAFEVSFCDISAQDILNTLNVAEDGCRETDCRVRQLSTFNAKLI